MKYKLTKTVFGFNSDQVAYPVGKDKQAYNIHTMFSMDTETNEIRSVHEVVTNPYSPEKPKEGDNTKYKEGTKFKTILFKGTYKECYDYVSKIVEEEGLWEYDSRMNYVHPKYS